jgi:hypothetical protein
LQDYSLLGYDVVLCRKNLLSSSSGTTLKSTNMREGAEGGEGRESKHVYMCVKSINLRKTNTYEQFTAETEKPMKPRRRR